MLSAANLLALDNVEGKIRSIAIGVFMRRLVTKVLMPNANAEAADFLAPFQVECRVKSGLDASVHKMRVALEQYGHDDDWISVSVDARNSFNMISRAAILAGIHAHARLSLDGSMPFVLKKLPS